MHIARKGVPQPSLRNVAVENGEIGRVEDAVAEPGERGDDAHSKVAIRQREQQGGEEKAADPGAEHPGGTVAIDEETGQRLADRRDDEKDRHRCPDAGEAQREILHQPREERRQQEMEEMRNAMREADQRDRFEVVARGRHGAFPGQG